MENSCFLQRLLILRVRRFHSRLAITRGLRGSSCVPDSSSLLLIPRVTSWCPHVPSTGRCGTARCPTGTGVTKAGSDPVCIFPSEISGLLRQSWADGLTLPEAPWIWPWVSSQTSCCSFVYHKKIRLEGNEEGEKSRKELHLCTQHVCAWQEAAGLFLEEDLFGGGCRGCV